MEKQRDSKGLDILDVLLVVFITLKLAGVISWSWAIVLSPLILDTVLVLLGIIAIEVMERINLTAEKRKRP